MTEYLFILSFLVVAGCLGVSLKPSPVYGGFCLVVSGCAGCLAVLGVGGSFLGLMVFLIYLGGMLVVFGYTAAMATEEYPETWMSSWMMCIMMVVGVLMEVGVVMAMSEYSGVGVVAGTEDSGGWIIYDSDELGLMGEGGAGMATA